MNDTNLDVTDNTPEINKDSTIQKLSELEKDPALANEFRTNYAEFNTIRKKLLDNVPLTPEEETKYGTSDIKKAKKQAEDNFIESYRKVALNRVKDYRDKLYSEMTVTPKENDFLYVMRNILKGPLVVVQMAWKVRYKLGWKIFRSESSAKKQKREYERMKEQERLAQQEQNNANNNNGGNINANNNNGDNIIDNNNEDLQAIQSMEKAAKMIPGVTG